MSFWKNKHLLIASVMAPVLGIASYFAVNHFVSEKPHVAETGRSYLLIEKPNCRYSSGNCGLKNGDFELQLSFEDPGNNIFLLKLRSEVPLDGVMLAMVENEAAEEQPTNMQAIGSDGLVWSLQVARPDPEIHRVHLAASVNQTLFYGDVSTKFTLIEN